MTERASQRFIECGQHKTVRYLDAKEKGFCFGVLFSPAFSSSRAATMVFIICETFLDLSPREVREIGNLPRHHNRSKGGLEKQMYCATKEIGNGISVVHDVPRGPMKARLIPSRERCDRLTCQQMQR